MPGGFESSPLVTSSTALILKQPTREEMRHDPVLGLTHRLADVSADELPNPCRARRACAGACDRELVQMARGDTYLAGGQG